MKIVANTIFVLLSFAVASSQGRLTGSNEEHKKIDGVLVDVFQDESSKVGIGAKKLDEPVAGIKGNDRRLDLSGENSDTLMEYSNLLSKVKQLLSEDPTFLKDMAKQRQIIETTKALMKSTATDLVEKAMDEYGAPVDTDVENTVVEEICFGTFLIEIMQAMGGDYLDDMPPIPESPYMNDVQAIVDMPPILDRPLVSGPGDDCELDEECPAGLFCNLDTYSCDTNTYTPLDAGGEGEECEYDEECGEGLSCDDYVCSVDTTADEPLLSEEYTLGDPTLSGLGEECELDEECAEGLSCDDYVCSDYTSSALESPETPYVGGPGEECEFDEDCASGLSCDVDTYTCYTDTEAVEDSPVTPSLSGLGELCHYDEECAEGLSCDDYVCSDYTSSALESPETPHVGGPGEECEFDDNCAFGLSCDVDTYTCYTDTEAVEDSPVTPSLSGLGEECEYDEECAEGLSCGDDYVCSVDTSAALESPETPYVGGPGEECEFDEECESGLWCDDYTCSVYTNTPLEYPDTQPLSGLGEECEFDGECEAGLLCDDYVCYEDPESPEDGLPIDYCDYDEDCDFGFVCNNEVCISAAGATPDEPDDSHGTVVDYDYPTESNSTNTGTEEVQEYGNFGGSGPYVTIPDEEFIYDEVNDPDGEGADEMYDY